MKRVFGISFWICAYSSMSYGKLPATTSWSGEFNCPSQLNSCELIAEKGTLNQENIQLYLADGKTPFKLENMDGAYLRFEGVRQGKRLRVFRFRLDMPKMVGIVSREGR